VNKKYIIERRRGGDKNISAGKKARDEQIEIINW
jgi:hypothetical protein